MDGCCCLCCDGYLNIHGVEKGVCVCVVCVCVCGREIVCVYVMCMCRRVMYSEV